MFELNIQLVSVFFTENCLKVSDMNECDAKMKINFLHLQLLY